MLRKGNSYTKMKRGIHVLSANLEAFPAEQPALLLKLREEKNCTSVVEKLCASQNSGASSPPCILKGSLVTTCSQSPSDTLWVSPRHSGSQAFSLCSGEGQGQFNSFWAGVLEISDCFLRSKPPTGGLLAEAVSWANAITRGISRSFLSASPMLPFPPGPWLDNDTIPWHHILSRTKKSL